MDPKEEPKDDLNFSLTRQEKPVTIDGQKYVLVELDGKERDMYLTGVSNRVKHNTDGKPTGVKTFDGLQASLVTACLRTDEGERKAVPASTIQTWPARVISKLFEAARDLNGLDDEPEPDAKEGNE